MKEERVRINKDFVEKECKTLHHKTVESEGAHKAFYDGIHSTIKRNKDWKRKTGETLSLQQTFLKEGVGLENAADIQVAWDAMNNLTCIVNTNTQDPDDEDEEFFPATLSPFKGILPGEYMETMSDVKTDTSATVKQETSVSTGVNSPRGFEEPKPDLLDQGAGAPPVPPEHSCHKSPSCKPIWGLLGCVELYKLTSVNERHLYCRLSNCCDKCGAATYPNHSAPLQDSGGKQKHKCSWGDSKKIAQCTKD